MQNTLTFNELPEAVNQLNKKLDYIANLLQSQKAISAPEKLLTIHQAADFLNVKAETVYLMVKRGDIASAKIGNRIYISRQGLIGRCKQQSKGGLNDAK